MRTRGSRILLKGDIADSKASTAQREAIAHVILSALEVNGNVGQVTSVRVFDPWPGVGFRNLTVQEATLASQGGTLMFIANARVSP